MRRRYITGLIAAALTSVLCLSSIGARSEEFREVRLGVRGNQLFIGGTPMMLTTYSSTGGAGQAGLSGNYQNVKLDLSTVPKNTDPWSVAIGAQVESGRTGIVVGLRNRFNNYAYIDSNYNVAKTPRALQSGLNAIELTFIERDHVILGGSLDVSVQTASGQRLPVKLGRYEIFTVNGVPRQPLLLMAVDKTTGKTATVHLFPYFIEKEPGSLLYRILDFTIGRELPVDPDYAH